MVKINLKLQNYHEKNSNNIPLNNIIVNHFYLLGFMILTLIRDNKNSENSEKLEVSDMIYWDIIQEPQMVEAPEESSTEVISWDGEENILVIEEENMNIDNVINLQIWDKTFDVVLEDNIATKALIEKLHEWDVVVNAREYWWFEKVGNLGFDLPRADKQISTEPGDLVLYQWNQVSLFYNSNSRSYTKLWKVQINSKEDLEKILWDWDVALVFSLK